MSTKIRCQAKNPATCSYHGSPQSTNSLKDRMNALIKGEPVYFAPYSKKASEFEVNIIIKTNSPKMQPIYIDVKGNSYEDIQGVVDQTLKGLKLKDLKTWYEAEVYLPNSDNEDSLKVRNWVSSTKLFSDEEDTKGEIDSLKQDISSQIKNQTISNNKFNEVINAIKDSKIAQSVSGAKAIAVIEAMNEFKFFQLKDDHDVYYVQSAFTSVLNETREYTNRGYGVRVHMDYKPNGEMRNVRFSLDNENDIWNTYSKEQIKQTNEKLRKYFDSFDK